MWRSDSLDLLGFISLAASVIITFDVPLAVMMTRRMIAEYFATSPLDFISWLSRSLNFLLGYLI